MKNEIKLQKNANGISIEFSNVDSLGLVLTLVFLGLVLHKS